MKRILVLAALAAVAIAPVAAQNAVTPEYKWTKGGTASYRLDVKKVSKATGAQEFELDQTWFYLFDTEVADVAPDGTATVRVKFGNAGVQFQIPAQSMDFQFDPGNPEDEKRAGSPLAVPFVAVAGETVSYKIAKNGRLMAVEGLAEMFQRIGEKVKAAPQGANYYGIAMSALDDMRTVQMETLFRRLPETPVKPGDSYKTPKVRESHPAVGSLLVQADCSFAGAEPAAGGEAWKISCTTSKTPESAEAKSPGKLVEARSTSEFLLAKGTGAMVKNSYGSVMAVEQALPAQAGAAPDAPPAKITQRDEITATLELQTGAPPAEASPAAAPPSGS